MLLRLGSGPGVGEGWGDKGSAVCTPSTRGERGPRSWAKFPGTHVPPVPLPALGQGIPQGPGTHGGGSISSPWGRVHCTDSLGPERTGVHTPVLLVC